MTAASEVEEILTNLGCTAEEARRTVERAAKAIGADAPADVLLSESLGILSGESR
jgi:hypothetical protein